MNEVYITEIERQILTVFIGQGILEDEKIIQELTMLIAKLKLKRE